VSDPAFAPGSFFDPADLVQVKYEMVRQAETGGAPAARAAPAFGFSRQSLYTARAALREQGLAGLIPGKPGPKGGHKLTGEVVSHLEELLAADPRLRPADLAAAAGQRFGVTVHPRSVELAIPDGKQCIQPIRQAITQRDPFSATTSSDSLPNIRLIVPNRFRGCESADRPVRKRHRRAAREDRAVARAPHVGPPVPSVSAADWQGPFRAATDSPR